MKKVRLLLLTALTILMFVMTGCQVAGNSCETDSDCTNENDKCFAGYCGDQEPTGGFYLKYNLLDKNGQVGSANLKCAEANIKDVKVEISTHGFQFDEPITIPCEDVNANDILDQNNGNGYLIGNLWPDENYDVKTTFMLPDGGTLVKEMSVRPSLAPANKPSTPEEANVLVEKVLSAIFTVKWDLEAADGTVYSDASSCDELGISSFRIAMDEMDPCDENGVCDFSSFVKVPCTSDWQTSFTVREAKGSTIGIYAVKVNEDTGGLEIPFSVNKAITITQEQLESGAFERKFHLDDNRGNK